MSSSEAENCYYVYALVDPINRQPFYIGKGKGNRMYQHFKNDNKNEAKHKYIQNIRMLGFEPFAVKINDNLSESWAYYLEGLLIKAYREEIFPFLTNIKSVKGMQKVGRKKGSKIPKEVIEKRSETVRQKHRDGYKRPPISDAQKKKVSEANLGKEGPNKVYVDIDLLKHYYLTENMTKPQVMEKLNIGMATLNRVIKENQIIKVNQYKYRNQDERRQRYQIHF